jgi:tetratricopeptide (TPR) repeat protein
MSASRRKQKPSKVSNPPVSELRDKAVSKPARPAISRRRKWLYRLTTAVIAPLLFFAILETGLRLGGYGYSTAFFIGSDTDGTYTTNPRFGWRFFPRSLARKPVRSSITAKPEGTVRIFVLGSSAAQGVPEPSFSFGRILEVMLRERYPEMKFEVINAAMTAINSYVTLEIARDCAAHQPDLFIVYMGNNEIVGPYGPGTVFQQWSPSLRFIRANIWVKSTRLGQLLGNAVRYFRSHESNSEAWRGMEMFMDNQVSADDPRLATVYSNFRRNLVDICSIAKRAGAGTILSTVPVNLEDCPPFASQHRSDLSAEELAKWKSIYQTGIEKEANRQWAEAIKQYEAAARIDDHYAELSYRMGRCFAAEERFKDARERFILARDLDVLRFRADSRINEAIREVAANQEAVGVHLLDAECAFAENDLAPHGIPGANLFYEHVHLTFNGNYLLARTVLEQVEATLPQMTSRKQAPVPSKEQCSELLALTAWDEYQLADEMMAMTSRPPFINQLDNGVSQAEKRKQIEALGKNAKTPNTLLEVREVYEAALKKAPKDWNLHHRLGALMMENGQPDTAAEHFIIAQKLNPFEPLLYIDSGEAAQKCGRMNDAIADFRKALELEPGYAMAHFKLGVAFATRGEFAQAITHYRKSLEIDPQNALGRYDLGVALYSSKKIDEAVVQFQKALEIDPTFAMARYYLGVVNDKRGLIDEAISQYREALEIDPNIALAHLNLGIDLFDQGWTDKAIVHYRKALEIDPRCAIAAFNLGVALAGRGQLDEAILQYQKALEIDPKYLNAHLNLGCIQASRGQIDEAILQFRKALDIDPRCAMAYFNLGKTLVIRGQTDEAITQFRKALEIKPGFTDARKNLDDALIGHLPSPGRNSP